MRIKRLYWISLAAFIVGCVMFLFTGCVTGARTPTEVLDTVKLDMQKGQVYDLVDVQYFRDNESFLGAVISEIEVTRKGRLLDFTVAGFYDFYSDRPYYGFFFFDTATNSDVALIVFEWGNDVIVATGTIPFARAQEITEEKYERPFRREVSKAIDAVVLVPLTEYADESYWHWLETGELPQSVLDGIAEWNGYYLAK